jgi:hypothetical protein
MVAGIKDEDEERSGNEGRRKDKATIRPDSATATATDDEGRGGEESREGGE